MLSIPFRKLSITDLFSKIANFSANFASFCKRSLAFASTHAILCKTHFSLLKTPEGELRNYEIGENARLKFSRHLQLQVLLQIKRGFRSVYRQPVSRERCDVFLKKFKERSEKRVSKFKKFQSRITQQQMNDITGSRACFDAIGLLNNAV